jgi:hypothetical protein
MLAVIPHLVLWMHMVEHPCLLRFAEVLRELLLPTTL